MRTVPSPPPVPHGFALVTGASAGTGREIAFALAEAGYDVGLLGRRTPALELVAERVRTSGGNGLVLTCDLCDAAAVAQATESFLAWSGGRADALINAAGIPGPLSPPVGEIAVDDFDQVIAVNLRGAFLTMSHLLPVMKRAGGGRVVNIGGTHGLRGRVGRASYSASKWALRGLTRSAALEAGQFGVTVNLVAPGAIAVDRMRAGWTARAACEGVSEQLVLERYADAMGIALGRTNDPADVVAMVLFLLSEGARNITGQELVVDGGTVV